MIVRRRNNTRIKPSAFVVALLSLAVLNSNFLDVWSFSTTTTTSIRRTQPLNGGTGFYHDQERICHRTLATKISAQTSNTLQEDTKTKRQTNSNKKRYKDREEQQQRERKRRELQNKLHRARDSILYYGQHDESAKDSLPSMELRSRILPEIIDSYTTAIAWEMDESIVENLFDLSKYLQPILLESRPVQERILGLLAVMIQVVAHIREEHKLYNQNIYSDGNRENVKAVLDEISFFQSNLWNTSREILRNMSGMESQIEPYIVSPIAITALAKALRESKYSNDNGSGVEEIKELMQLVDSARNEVRRRDSTYEEDSALDRALESTWNTYLSSMCDQALDKNNPSDIGLATAAKLVMENDNGDIVDSNLVSYNTVMNIAAKVGNASLVNTMWKDLSERQGSNFQPNSRTYNTRLMITNDDAQRLEILDKEIIPAAFQLQRENSNSSASSESSGVIDSFTIDMVMMPLLQANRKKHLFQLIDHWMTLVNRQHNVHQSGETKRRIQSAQRAFKNAMAAFFITLVQKNGDVRTARELWNRYMIMNTCSYDEISNSHSEAFLRATNIVYPERRHYNILLDGYARLVDQARDRQARHKGRNLDDDNFSEEDKEKTPKKKIWEAAIREIDNKNQACNTTSTSEFYEELQEKAIRDGQELFALMMAEQQQQNARNKIGPDAYTKSTMTRLCRSGSEVLTLLQKTSNAASDRNNDRKWLPRAVTRAAVTTCGRLGDPSMACIIFDQFMFPDFESNSEMHLSNYRAFNVLLGALAAGAKLDNPRLDLLSTEMSQNNPVTPSFLLSEIHGLTCTEAVVHILNLLTRKNSRTYCVAASALQYAPIDEKVLLTQAITNTTMNQTSTIGGETTPLALQIFNNATRDGVHADGRLINAIFRCYGDDISGALAGWKSDIRKATYKLEEKMGGKEELSKKNMLAAYSGLLYVCGRAERPDIAVRIVYAMKNKEDIEITETAYNNYQSGKSARKNSAIANQPKSGWREILPKIDMVKQYENILYVECKKYDTRDRRMEKDNRIRIIV